MAKIVRALPDDPNKVAGMVNVFITVSAAPDMTSFSFADTFVAMRVLF